MRIRFKVYSIRNAGFTLVEVMIVVGIFAVISSVSYTSLSQYLNITSELDSRQQRIQDIQRAFTLIERDIRYVVPRASRDEYGDFEPAFVVHGSSGLPGEILRFTTMQPDFEFPALGQLQRVAWRLDENSLSRDSWEYLDRNTDAESRSVRIISNVDSIDLETFSWSDSGGIESSDDYGDDDTVPYGIRIKLVMQDGTEYQRLFDIANGT